MSPREWAWPTTPIRTASLREPVEKEKSMTTEGTTVVVNLGTCEICEHRPADREVTVVRGERTRSEINFKVCAHCALFLVGHERD